MSSVILMIDARRECLRRLVRMKQLDAPRIVIKYAQINLLRLRRVLHEDQVSYLMHKYG